MPRTTERGDPRRRDRSGRRPWLARAGDGLYGAAWAAALCGGSLYVALRAMRHRREMSERFGNWRPLPAAAEGALWVHAASLGEMRGALPLLRELNRRGRPAALSVVTPTARDLAAEAEAAGARAVRFAPLDAPSLVRRTLGTLRPPAVLVCETEVWPGMIAEIHRARIPLAFVSARLTERGAGRLRRLGSWLQQLLSGVYVAAQTGGDAERWLALGIPPEQIAVTGNTKYESPRGRVPEEERARVRGDWHRVIVFGSVRRAEAEALAHALDALREIPGPLLLVVALRHPDGADALRRRLEAHGLPILERRELGGPLLPSVRSVAAACAPQDPDTLRAVLLVTTVGELRGFYAAADLAFVGGTLCPVGGHSLFEPAELGVPVFYGSYVSNVADVAAVLEDEGGGFRAATGLELGRTLAGLATSPDKCRVAAGAALRGAERVGGAVGRTLDALEAWGFPVGEAARPLAEGRSDGLA